jgi:hypothetical protein
MCGQKLLVWFFAWLTCPMLLRGQDVLSAHQPKMLQDPSGWEYIKIPDVDNGIQTEHTCFDGHPHPQQCSGTLSTDETSRDANAARSD